ncbi:plastid division protein PDV2 [Mercurialis annua]|uniref:plastid division protein PDV2 n=1 Tax=Mercurialis annua TaxID=3986 RepID=UPI0024AD807B|nr:plastid division protein PDV2 [Mercurialis annua]
MEEEGVEVVLARAIELRLKISNCIHNSNKNVNGNSGYVIEEKEEGFEKDGVKEKKPNLQNPKSEGAEEQDDDLEAERLLHISDALECLEHQLSNLQALQQQQRYEREVALSEIEHSRKMLLDKLKEYKGKDFGVIQEASAFAGETVEHNNDLLLPPYPTRPPQSLVADKRHLPYPSTRKPVWNGGEAKKNLNGSDKNEGNAMPKSSSKGLGHVIGMAAKTMITVLGVISVISLSGFGPKLGNRSIPFKMMSLFQQPANEEKRNRECPPGRIPILQDGEARCVVKERVAIPFESVFSKPDVNYGTG